jgi:hypothetical protein
MGVFGVLTMRLSDNCLIRAPTGRCCHCLEADEAKMGGQAMPTVEARNDIYYGVIMLINSLFGMYYVVQGLKAENKYQLICIMITQTLEVARGMVDTLLEDSGHNETLADTKVARAALMYAATFLLIVSACLLPRVYRQFGWKIFDMGGSNTSVRQMYKWYQRYRAVNRIDVQSSFLLFLLIVMYIKGIENGGIGGGAWIFVFLFITDTMASRFMIKYLKREDMAGVAITTVAKVTVIVWWIVVVTDYTACYDLFARSREQASGFFALPYYPDLPSVARWYRGTSCLSNATIHSQRSWELIVINLVQAIVCRLLSFGNIFVCVRNFGKGLKPVFYKVEEFRKHVAAQNARRAGGDGSDDDNSDAEGEMTYVPKGAQQFAANAGGGGGGGGGAVATGGEGDYRRMETGGDAAGEESADARKARRAQRKRSLSQQRQREDPTVREIAADDKGW